MLKCVAGNKNFPDERHHEIEDDSEGIDVE